MRSIKRIGKPALRIGCFLLMFWLLCLLCNHYLTPSLEFGRSMRGFYGETHRVTTVFLGASIANDAYQPDAYDEAMGEDCYSYSLTSPGQSVAASYYLLREAFAYQQPDTVLVDASWCVLGISSADDPATNAVADLMVMDAMRLSGNKLRYMLCDLPSENLVDAVFPFFRFRDRYNLRYMKKNFEQKQNDAGNPYTSRGQNALLEHPSESTGPLHIYGWHGEAPHNMEKLRAIIALCREKGAVPILVAPPVSYATLTALPNYQEYLDTMSAFAQEQGVDFVDFSLVREDVLARPNTGYGWEDQRGVHMLGETISLPYTRLAAQAVRELRAGTFDPSAYLYASYDELMASINAVCGAWAEYDPAARMACFGCYAPAHIAPEYRYAVKTAGAEGYPAFTAYDAAATADLSALPAGDYVLRVEARAAGSAAEYEQCYELSFTVE